MKLFKKAFFSALFGFLSNIFYFEGAQILVDDFEFNELKLDLLTSICYLILTPNHAPILVEGLRVIANLCRNKKVIDHLFVLNYGEGRFISFDYFAIPWR